MSNELTVPEAEPRHALTASDIKANVNLIQEVMKSVMKKDVHYGTVPGCGSKVVLLKPGAEKIMSTFRIAAEPHVEDLSGPDECRYRITCNGVSMANGTFLGGGVGECSSSEDKYKWKKPSCDKEFETTAEDRKRIKYKSDYGKTIEIKQIRTSPADVANTVLKMAKKRALVDMVLTVTAASDCFEQDLEEITDEFDVNRGAKTDIKPPQQTQTPEQPKQTPPAPTEPPKAAPQSSPTKPADASVELTDKVKVERVEQWIIEMYGKDAFASKLKEFTLFKVGNEERYTTDIFKLKASPKWLSSVYSKVDKAYKEFQKTNGIPETDGEEQF